MSLSFPILVGAFSAAQAFLLDTEPHFHIEHFVDLRTGGLDLPRSASWEDDAAKLIDGQRFIISRHGLLLDSSKKTAHRYTSKASLPERLRNYSCPLRSTERNVEMLHIPKTGGESIERALLLDKNHYPMSSRRNSFFNGTQRKDIFVFSIIRNPFDRMWSWFRFCVHGWNGRLPEPYDDCESALNATLRMQDSHQLTKENVRHAFSNWLHRLHEESKTWQPPHRLHIPPIWSPMTHWLVDPNTNQMVPDFLIRFEHLYRDFDRLCNCTGLSPEHGSLPYLNSGTQTWRLQPKVQNDTIKFLSEAAKNYYNAESISRVRQMFKEDFETFEYPTSLP